MAALQAALILVGVAVAAFALWGSWEMARMVPTAPQALLGAIPFALTGVGALVAAVLGARAARPR